MKTEYAILDSLLLLTILYIIWLIFQQWSWSRSFNQPQTKKTKTPQPLKSKTDHHIMDAAVHALVGYGSHGKQEQIQDLIFAHIQLDELWANVRQASQEVWLWVATQATTKVIPVIRLGPQTMDMAMVLVLG